MLRSKKYLVPALILVLLTTLSLTVNAQEKNPVVHPDTAWVLSEEESLLYMELLDSLYLAWQNGRLPIEPYTDSVEAAGPIDRVTDTPDSIFVQRLRSLPSGIELTFNKQVRSYLDLYTKNRKNQVGILLGLADYYFPMIEAELDKRDLPLELKYLPIIESALNPFARSRAGAVGMWQFMLGTARLYKLNVNTFIDERMDPVRSTQVACDFLKELYQIYGDWHLVIAAYNCGPGNVRKAIQRAGGKSNYWDIYYYLPRETRGFVPKFIAATYIMNFHELHGFHALKPEITIDTDTVMVAEELHLAQVSDYLDIDMSVLEKLNPKYRRKILPGAGGPYDLRLPVDRVNQFIAYQDSIIVHKNDIYLAKNNIDKEPAPRNRRSTPPSPDDVALNYTVKSGDNLGFISSWYGVSVSALKDWNGLYGNVIRSGQKLTVYVNKSKADELRRINDLSFEDKQARIGKTATVVTADATPGPSPSDNQFVLYTVKRGDNLWDIARLYPGISNEDIKRLNNMTSNNLKPGQILKIKRREG